MKYQDLFHNDGKKSVMKRPMLTLPAALAKARSGLGHRSSHRTSSILWTLKKELPSMPLNLPLAKYQGPHFGVDLESFLT